MKCTAGIKITLFLRKNKGRRTKPARRRSFYPAEGLSAPACQLCNNWKWTAGIKITLFLRKNKGRLCEARRGRPPFFFKAGGDPDPFASRIRENGARSPPSPNPNHYVICPKFIWGPTPLYPKSLCDLGAFHLSVFLRKVERESKERGGKDWGSLN